MDMGDPVVLGQLFDKELGGELREAGYLYADTRVPAVSLYDHLRLTAGLASALVRELLQRGASPEEILGESLWLSDKELLAVARLAGLLHDLGKAREGQTDYRRHVRRGVEYARAWLERHQVEEPLLSILIEVVARHHLRDRPQTLLEKVVCLADSYASAGDRPELARAVTPQQFRQAAREIQELERGLFGEAKQPICLLLADADHIKGYVYETNALPEIRGGSELLLEVERNVKREFEQGLAEESLIYCGGGGLLAVVPASEADAWRRKVEACYLEVTRGATVTVVVSPPLGYAEFARGLPPQDALRLAGLRGRGLAEDLLLSHFGREDRDRRKNFGELVAELTGRLQRAKREKTWAPFFEALPVHRRCDSCGKHPAAYRDQRRAEWLCSLCEYKRRRGRQERREIFDRFQRWLKETKGVRSVGKPPDDLDELAGKEGRIALIYADGNNIGDLLQRAPSPATYRHISASLTLATEEALFQALWKTVGPKALQQGSLPFEVIALGGDDVVVLTRASAGYALALAILEEFERHEKIRKLEEEFAQRLDEPSGLRLTISAGVVMADVKYPMRFLFDLAEGLLKEAKGFAREQHQSILCHLWLRAPVIAEEAKALLNVLYKRENRHLTARPYTLEQARTLLEVARRLAEVPAHARRGLAESLKRGVYVSLNHALYQAARLRDHKEILMESFWELGRFLPGNESTQGLYFWRQDPEQAVWKTALLDVLELIELEAHAYPQGREEDST